METRLCCFGIACTIALSLQSVQPEAVSSQSASSNNIPLPIVTRTNPVIKDPFDQGSIVVLARIWKRSEVEEGGFEGQSLNPIRFWTCVSARLWEVLRVNERKQDDPNLATGYFQIEQIARMEKPIYFRFGRQYLLFLTPSRDIRFRASSSEEPAYSLAAPQGGFEIVKGRLVPLIEGGPLDTFKGRLLSNVINAIRSKPTSPSGR